MGSVNPPRINAAETANNKTTNAGNRTIAPTPIIAAARPAWLAFSDSSARASSNSLLTSLASCPTASLKSSGIDRLTGEFIAISLAGHVRAILPAIGIGAARVAAGKSVSAGLTRLRYCRFGIICRSFQKAYHAKTGKHRHAEERGRLPARKGLRARYQILEVAGSDRVGNVLDLRRRLADVNC